jgi:hypothetical protein
MYYVGESFHLVSPHAGRSNQVLLAHNINIVVVLNKTHNYFIVAAEVEIIGSSREQSLSRECLDFSSD